MSKKCACGREMVFKAWKHQWVCTRCGRTKYVDDAPTNADHIRSMTDTELAEIIMCPRGFAGPGIVCAGKTCRECALNWLRQTYGKDEDEEDGE